MTNEPTNQWIDRFKSHGLHQTLSASIGSLDAADERGKDDLAAIHASQRVRAAFERTTQILNTCDPLLVSGNILDNLNSYAANAIAEINNFVSSGNQSHLTNANAQVDAILVASTNLPLPPSVADSIVATADAFRSAVDRHLASLRVDANRLRSELESLQVKYATVEADISNQKARLDNAISQFQQQAATAESERTSQFGQSELARQTTAATNEEGRRAATSAIVAKSEEFLSSQQLAHEKTMSERATAFEANIEAQKKEFEKHSSDIKLSANGVIEKIGEELKKAEKIVHVVGNTGMVGGYQKTANEEKESATTWNRITVGAMSILVIGAIYLVAETPSSFSWSYLASRIFVATSVAILATYAGRQAALHRDEARSLRRIELEIASIDPYLALLPEEERNAVKKNLADRMFAQPARSKDAEKVAPSGSAADPLRIAIEGLLKLLEKR